MNKQAERIGNAMPKWFELLLKGERILGRGKDELVLEIIKLGGLDLLRSRGGLRIAKNSPLVMKLSAQQLRAIKRELTAHIRKMPAVRRSVAHGISKGRRLGEDGAGASVVVSGSFRRPV